MSIKELVGRLIILGGLAVGGYMLYNMLYVEPVTRKTSVRELPSDLERENGSEKTSDDCERYVNPETAQSCIESRSKQ